ncbi:cupin [Mesorhizobium loti]|uniref:cupin n=1 Tax=Rhizobium loti TaxID=381 RepID=UPI000413122F|nr:cupin [Mesorhizobium loti]
MTILESPKKAVERVTGFAKPSEKKLAGLVRLRKANAFRFKDDGLVPNHPAWPLVVYRGAVRLPAEFDPAAVMEALFGANGWGDSWRNGIYDYVHYHSQIHEVLGVARDTAKVQFGGKKGRTLSLKAGDVAVLPAGTGHQCLSASGDFLVVGAYPPSGTYDECTTAEQHRNALATIPKVGRPRKDPVYGSKGPLLGLFTNAR